MLSEFKEAYFWEDIYRIESVLINWLFTMPVHGNSGIPFRPHLAQEKHPYLIWDNDIDQ